MTKNKKALITLAVMAAVLVALVVVYFVVVLPLIQEGPEVPVPEGDEGIFANKITLYEPISEDQLISIHVKNAKDEYTFKRVKGNDGKYSTVVVGLESLKFDESYYAYLRTLALTPITVENQVYRNCTPEKMAEYGVTDDTCQSTLTVKLTNKEGKEETHIIRIGHLAFTGNPSYYVSIDDRPHVYRFSSTAQTALIPLADFISPIINIGYSTSAEAMLEITRFYIAKGPLDNLKRFVVLTAERYLDAQGAYSTEYMFHVLNDAGYSIKSTRADYEYVLNSLSIFYTQFLGDMVVKIEPSDEDLVKYGIGPDDEGYFVYAQDSEGKELPTFFISKPIYDEEYKQDFYYTLATQGEIRLLVRIPKSAFVPINQYKDPVSVVLDETKVINWAATNTIGTGFSQAIKADGVKYNGVKSLTIKLPTSVYQYGEETFYINYVNNVLKVTSKSGRYKDESSATIKPFNQFYYTLISHPLASKFNTLSDAEIDAIIADPSNHLYTIEAEINPDEGTTECVVERYAYYKLSSEYVIVHRTDGTYVNGVFVESEASVKRGSSRNTIFDTVRSQITDYVYRDFLALMDGSLETVQ